MGMTGLTEEKIDKLINDAIYLCQTIDTASPPFFQRSLMIDWDTAMLVFQELVESQIITNVYTTGEGTEINYIGEINQQKITELRNN
jgi:hypothetical protein